MPLANQMDYYCTICFLILKFIRNDKWFVTHCPTCNRLREFRQL